MIGKIETSQDIVSEKERLTAEAEMHKGHIKESLETLKNEVKITSLTKDVLRSKITPEILKYGACIGSFIVLNALVPRRTSWVIRLAAPFLANRYLGKAIEENYYSWSNNMIDKINKSETEKRLNQSL